jgi:hypothetical protein
MHLSCVRLIVQKSFFLFFIFIRIRVWWFRLCHINSIPKQNLIVVFKPTNLNDKIKVKQNLIAVFLR